MSFVIGLLNCRGPLWLVHWIVCVLCDWFTGLSVSFVIGLLDCLCSLWLVYWIVCVLCDWFTWLSVFFVIGSLDCLCPLWLVHCIVFVLCNWFTGLFVSFVIGQSDYFDFGFMTISWKLLQAGLKKNPVRLSRTSRFFLRASNFLSFLARWAMTQASHLPTKIFDTVFRRQGKL